MLHLFLIIGLGFFYASIIHPHYIFITFGCLLLAYKFRNY